MGYRVENYSLDELHRVAVPGAVAPSLFWALPVGNWRPGELDEVWSWFTEHQSECNEFGLLLVKDWGRGPDEDANVNLAQVGGKLSDLMPAGAERFVTRSALRGEMPRVLVLAGGYPQPGWGVLVEWRRENIRRFEQLICLAMASLRNEQSTDQLDVFREAAQSFHRWRDLRAEKPTEENVASLANEILAGEKVVQLIRSAQSALQVGQHSLFQNKFLAAMQEIQLAGWLGVDATTIDTLQKQQQTFTTATSILAAPTDAVSNDIAGKVDFLIDEPSKREATFKGLASQEMKQALSACLDLRKKQIVGAGGNFSAWAEQALADSQPKLVVAVSDLMLTIETKLTSHRGVKAQCEHKHAMAVQEWRQRSTEAEESFRLAAGKAVEIQWEIGPKFLVTFEHICRQEGLWVRSIPWDPARMVGWKIMASQVRIDSRDLQVAARELVAGATEASSTNGLTTAVADGSYFTDYVHYIAISRPGFSPRAVTRDLLARLVRPAEMMTLIRTHGGEIPLAADAPCLAEELLHVFGWRQSDELREKPLAGCVEAGGGSSPILAESLSGNDLRIVLESFCKDIVDVVVAQLGYSNTGVWTAIEERIPAYRPASRTKNWEEEVRAMTVGGALMILPALGPLAFPARTSQVSEFVACLSKLSEILNVASHHHEVAPRSSRVLDEAPGLIRELLNKAEAFLGELPWHLEASFVYGEQPKVLSGEAWSHGSPTPRLLRVIVWTGTSPGSHITLWNKTSRNPIVTDPVFIMRPVPDSNA